METGYLFALTTGLLGGFGHCIGMCGPLVAGPVLHQSSQSDAAPPAPMLPQILYHAGRITTYAAVGACMGMAGSFVNVAGKLAGVQNSVMVLAGLVMIFMGLGIVGLFTGTKQLEQHNVFVLRAAKKLLGGSSPLRYYPLGLILGLLPCGLSYTVFIAAAGTGAPVAGMLIMLSFGAGTVPALALFGALVSYFSSRARGLAQKAGGVAVIAMGAFYIIKGIRLYAEM